MNHENNEKDIANNMNVKLTLRKKDVNNILDSNRKMENFDPDDYIELITNNYIVNIEDINIPEFYKINNIQNFNINVNTYHN